MALASTNPIRLSDAHLMCTGEYLITPYEITQNGQTLKPLGWLTHLPGRLSSVNSAVPETELATSLVIASTPAGLRTGLILRMRMLPENATPAQCQEAMRLRQSDYARIIAEEGLAPVRPLAAEGVYALLPRDGLRFLCRARNEKKQPLHSSGMTPVSFSFLEKLVAHYPGSGLCITILPDSVTEAPGRMDFLIASWGFPAITSDIMSTMNIPLEPFSDLTPEDPLAGFQFLYDPWALRFRIRKPTWGDELVSTSVEEMTALLGLYARPAPPPSAEPAPASQESEARQMAHGMAADLSGLKSQMRGVIRELRQNMQDQVQQQVGSAVHGVQQQLSQAMAQVTAMPGVHRDAISSALERMRSTTNRLSPQQMAEEARAAGLDQPIGMSTLMKMGFRSEQALLDAGFTPDLLCLLRSTVQLREQCPACCDADANCMPYAFMVGYMYEALISKCFAPFFRATGGSAKAKFLSDYTRIDTAHLQEMARFAGAQDSAMRSCTMQDWAVWLTLCNMLRSLRNRQHSDTATGFICHDEMAAAFGAFLFPGTTSKRTLLQLPAFSDTPPAWAREFQPALPADWGQTHAAQRKAIAAHFTRHGTAFQPSILQLLLRCGKMASGKEGTC